MPISIAVTPGTLATALLAPVFFVFLIIMCFGLACLLATANVFFRDVSHLVSVILLPLFFMTPVFYGLESFPQQPPEWVITALRYGNPITPYIEGIRATTLEGQVPGVTLMVYCFVLAPCVAALGIWVLRRNDEKFAVEL